ncbi:MAG TPA: PDC sensor domain-containing protein, partial [Thermoanaerobaculia bacterium]
MADAQPLSIRWWLGGIVAAVGLPLLILLVWIYAIQVRRERSGARQEAYRIAASAGARLRALHVESLSLLRRISARPAVRQLDRSGCDAVFVVVDVLPQYANLFLFDARGSLVCSARPDLKDERTSFLARQWVEAELARGSLRPGEPMIRPIESRWITILSVPVTGLDGSVLGTLVLVQLPEVFSEEM